MSRPGPLIRGSRVRIPDGSPITFSGLPFSDGPFAANHAATADPATARPRLRGPSQAPARGAVSARGNRTIPCGEFPVIMWVDMRRRLALAAALLVTTGSGTWAGPPTDQLHGRIDRVLKVLGEPALKNDAKTTERRDRKSTRLNSSHLVISYAVFCLKKKKTNK